MKIQDLAYVLHRKPYRDTSYLVDFFTQNHGIVTAVCRGVRQTKKKSSLEPFIPFWIEYGSHHHSHSSLVTLYQYEPERHLNNHAQETSESPHVLGLVNRQLYCGLYLNELLIKLLGKDDAYTEVFEAYQMALKNLVTSENLERSLRKFEFFLLKEVGYGIPFEKDIKTNEAIVSDKSYYYCTGSGFAEINMALTKGQENGPVFTGKSLLAIANDDFSDEIVLKEAKRLIRLTLDALLERYGKLKSRALFPK